MKVSDYIVKFLIDKGVEHFFGYQGTMIAHFVDSICNNENAKNHICYNEQGAAFAAVGFSKASGKIAVAYATSGPGAINLLSGIADAYYDSVPVIFITGQLNTYEYTGIKNIRQNGFQETDIISIVSSIVKYCEQVKCKEDICTVLDKAYNIANTGRPGPVLIDLPMDIQRQEIEPNKFVFNMDKIQNDVIVVNNAVENIINSLNKAKSPVFLIGSGIKRGSNEHRDIISIANKLRVPIITSMLAKHLLEYDNELNFGYLGGGYGHRYANMIIHKKADLIISLGCSLCKRQTTMNTENFAKNAKIIRIDIDPNELMRKVHENEYSYNTDCKKIITKIGENINLLKKHDEWLKKCKIIKLKLSEFDSQSVERYPNIYLDTISDFADEDMAICCDVGQHQVWTAQSFKIKKGQTLLFSGGHGAMGFALPAAIGAYYGTGNRVMAICGDGAMQMNIQELQCIVNEKIPATIIVLNNNSLGLIQQQQDDIFDSRYYASVKEGGYMPPDFQKIGQAYGILSYKVKSISELKLVLNLIGKKRTVLIEIILDVGSRAFPKTFFGEEMHNQKPYIPEELMEYLLNI